MAITRPLDRTRYIEIENVDPSRVSAKVGGQGRIKPGPRNPPDYPPRGSQTPNKKPRPGRTPCLPIFQRTEPTGLPPARSTACLCVCVAPGESTAGDIAGAKSLGRPSAPEPLVGLSLRRIMTTEPDDKLGKPRCGMVRCGTEPWCLQAAGGSKCWPRSFLFFPFGFFSFLVKGIMTSMAAVLMTFPT